MRAVSAGIETTNDPGSPLVRGPSESEGANQRGPSGPTTKMVHHLTRLSATLASVPTSLKRTNVTHTPPIQAALRIAAAYWPDKATSDSALLTELALKGASDLQHEAATRMERLCASAVQINDAFGKLYSDQYLDEIRAGWPE